MSKIAIQLGAINTKIKIPRENTCKMLTDALNFAKLCEILETSSEKIRTQNITEQNTRETVKSGRHTDRQTGQMDKARSTVLAVCVYASKQGKTISRIGDSGEFTLPSLR